MRQQADGLWHFMKVRTDLLHTTSALTIASGIAAADEALASKMRRAARERFNSMKG